MSGREPGIPVSSEPGPERPGAEGAMSGMPEVGAHKPGPERPGADRAMSGRA